MDTTSTKPGWKTTEFWGKIAIQIFTLWSAGKGFVAPEKAVLITSLLEGVYTLARSIVKYKGGTLPDVPTL
jgi:hypothetical protein